MNAQPAARHGSKPFRANVPTCKRANVIQATGFRRMRMDKAGGCVGLQDVIIKTYLSSVDSLDPSLHSSQFDWATVPSSP